MARLLPRLDPSRVAKYQADIDGRLLRAKARAAKHIEDVAAGVVDEGAWSERSSRLVVNLSLVGHAEAAARASKEQKTTVTFGVVLMQDRLPDTPDGHAAWKAMGKAVERPAIEAVEVKRDAVPEQELQRGAGVGQVSGELRPGVRQAEPGRPGDPEAPPEAPGPAARAPGGGEG